MMKKLSVTLLALCSTFSFVPGASAEECKEVPTCAELGFTQNVSECTGAALKCPWDLSLAACKAGVKPETCKVGSILGGDQLCYGKELPQGVQPIGIVFDPDGQLATALTDINSSGSAGSATMQWSTKNSCTISGLDSCSNENCGTNGSTNTRSILASTACGSTPAATAANSYEASGCSKDFCKKNKWFLPSLKELTALSKAKSTINASLTQTAGSGAKTLTEKSYLTSTQLNSGMVWVVMMSDGSSMGASKTNSTMYVRPAIYYGEEKAGVPCSVGTIITDDKLCYDASADLKGAGVGVVFDAEKRLAISLVETNNRWGHNASIPSMESCNVSCGTGKENTDRYIQDGMADVAVTLCSEYEGGSNSWNGAGQWFLGSIQEFEKLYKNIASINNALAKQTAGKLSSNYWTSNVESASQAYSYDMATGSAYPADKAMSQAIRPMIEF